VRRGTAGESFEGQQVAAAEYRIRPSRSFRALAGGRAEVAVDLAGDVTLQAADDLRLGLSFGRTARHRRGWVRAQPGEHDPPQGMAALAATAEAVPVAGEIPGGRGDRGDAAQVRPGRLAAEPPGMIPGRDEQQRRSARAEPVHGEQARGAGSHQRDDELVQAAELARTASAESEVRPRPRLPTLRPCSVKIREAAPEALSTVSLPIIFSSSWIGAGRRRVLMSRFCALPSAVTSAKIHYGAASWCELPPCRAPMIAFRCVSGRSPWDNLRGNQLVS
jgi:hypothetical protein